MLIVSSGSIQERHTRPSDISRVETDTHMETRAGGVDTAMEDFKRKDTPLDNSVINDINMLSHNISIT